MLEQTLHGHQCAQPEASIAVATPLLGGSCVDPHMLRRRLREATRGPHEALDARFDAMTRDPSAYRSFLVMNAIAHRRLEPVIERCGAIDPVFASYVPMRVHLAEDCASLGLHALADTAPERDEPEIDPAAAAGILYVLEGSRLGARVILASLERATAPFLSATRYLRAAAASRGFASRIDGLACVLSQLQGADPEGADPVARAERAALAAFDTFVAAIPAEKPAPGAPSFDKGATP